MKKFDLVIIGNGIIGLSLAQEYTKHNPKAQVAVIGPAHRGGGATIAAGAMLGCFSEVTRNSLANPFYQNLLKASVYASKLWPNWLDSINSCLPQEQRIRIQPGTFVILNTETAAYEDDNYQAIIEASKQYSAPFEEVSPLSIPGFDPIDNCRPLKAVYLPKEGAISPHLLLDGLSNILIQKKVTLLDDTVMSMTASSQRINALITQKGLCLEASQVVLCAGVYSQALIDQIPSIASRIPRILSGVGSALLLRNTENKIPVKSTIRSPNRTGACGIHLVPCDYKADYLYLGASNSVKPYPDTEPKIRNIHYLLKWSMEQLNRAFHTTSIVKYLVGNRPVPLDTLPLIGETSLNNLWLATGTYRIGIELAPLIARFLTRRLCGKTWDQKDTSLAMFKPERPLVQIFDKIQSKNEFAKQYLGVGYEHNFSLPKVGWEPALIDAFQKQAESLYNRLETTTGLHSDVLIMLAQYSTFLPIVKRSIEENITAHRNESLISE